MRQSDGTSEDELTTPVKGTVRRESNNQDINTRAHTLGLDIGGVLIDRVGEGTQASFFGTNPMEAPAVPGSADGVKHLVSIFEHRVHIVSKTGPKVAALTMKWLTEHGYVQTTFEPAVMQTALTSPSQGGASPNSHAILRTNVHFVSSRQGKDPVCRDLGITHFVDDRIDVLEHLKTVEHRYLFAGGLGRHNLPEDIPAEIVIVEDWDTLLDHLAASLK